MVKLHGRSIAYISKDGNVFDKPKDFCPVRAVYYDMNMYDSVKDSFFK